MPAPLVAVLVSVSVTLGTTLVLHLQRSAVREAEDWADMRRVERGEPVSDERMAERVELARKRMEMGQEAKVSSYHLTDLVPVPEEGPGPVSFLDRYGDPSRKPTFWAMRRGTGYRQKKRLPRSLVDTPGRPRDEITWRAFRRGRRGVVSIVEVVDDLTAMPGEIVDGR